MPDQVEVWLAPEFQAKADWEQWMSRLEAERQTALMDAKWQRLDQQSTALAKMFLKNWAT